MAAKGRVVEMTAGTIASRSRQAKGFLAAARLVQEFAADAEIESAPAVVSSLTVLAGIAASDAICGHATGHRAAGEAHGEALSLLARSTSEGNQYAKDLGRLLQVKSTVQYSGLTVTESSAQNMLRWAQRLVDGMDLELSR